MRALTTGSRCPVINTLLLSSIEFYLNECNDIGSLDDLSKYSHFIVEDIVRQSSPEVFDEILHESYPGAYAFWIPLAYLAHIFTKSVHLCLRHS